MRYRLEPSHLKGNITMHPSKSQSHRAIIAASLAKGHSTLSNFEASDDTRATLNAVEQLGWAHYHLNGNCLTIEGGLCHQPTNPIFCDESATTLRLLMPLAIIKNSGATFTGRGLLLQRPMMPYINLFKEHGISYHAAATAITVKGYFKTPHLTIDGQVSSQFISGLLFSLPFLGNPSTLTCPTALASSSYITLTEQMLDTGLIILEKKPQQWICHRSHYQPFDLTLEGDYSNGAWFLAANSLGHYITLNGLADNSAQGDRAIITIIEQLTKADGTLLTIDGHDCIDLIPLIAVLCALRQGTTAITGIGRLRDKECDRLEAICTNLTTLGVVLKAGRDEVTITGRPSLVGGVTLSSFGDHRIAMAMALAALHADKPVILDQPSVVSKSYPAFWQHYKALGGVINEL